MDINSVYTIRRGMTPLMTGTIVGKDGKTPQPTPVGTTIKFSFRDNTGVLVVNQQTCTVVNTNGKWSYAWKNTETPNLGIGGGWLTVAMPDGAGGTITDVWPNIGTIPIEVTDA